MNPEKLKEFSEINSKIGFAKGVLSGLRCYELREHQIEAIDIAYAGLKWISEKLLERME